MIVRIEETTTYEVEVDPLKFAQAFDVEYLDFLGAEHPSDESLAEFVKESVHIMGALDFVEPAAEWVVNYTTDHDMYVQIS